MTEITSARMAKRTRTPRKSNPTKRLNTRSYSKRGQKNRGRREEKSWVNLILNNIDMCIFRFAPIEDHSIVIVIRLEILMVLICLQK